MVARMVHFGCCCTKRERRNLSLDTVGYKPTVQDWLRQNNRAPIRCFLCNYKKRTNQKKTAHQAREIINTNTDLCPRYNGNPIVLHQ